ncbi:MAG: hypothetical protein U0R49_05135 [Fimbriimonadales bacterium]
MPRRSKKNNDESRPDATTQKPVSKRRQRRRPAADAEVSNPPGLDLAAPRVNEDDRHYEPYEYEDPLGLNVGIMFRDSNPKDGPKAAPPKEKPSKKEESPAPQKKQKAEKKPARKERFKPKVTDTQEAATQQAELEQSQAAVNRFVPDLPEIETPKDAPQVVKINGTPVIVYRNQVVPPIMFFGSPSTEKKAEKCFEQIKKAASNGIHLHSILVEFPVEQERAQNAFDLMNFLLKNVLDSDPDALIMIRLVFAGAPGWEKNYPAAAYHYADGTPAEPSVSDDPFWEDAQKMLGAFVRGLVDLPNADRIIGIHLDRGEWFQSAEWGYDTSQAAEQAFREWCRFRYGGSEVSLQASWFDGRARFDTLRIPDYSEYPLSGEGFLRAQRKERRWVDYHLFLSDATVARIQRLAHEVKSASGGRLLVGVSYGYTFEWSHPASAHLSLGKLLRCREVDIIGGPPSYRDRDMGGTAAFPGPIDSFALNGKLYMSEEDYKTSITREHEPDEFNPVLGTPQALEAAHWRGLGSALVHGTGVAWMDLWGNGWLNTGAIWQRAAKVKESLIRSLGAERQDPEVAVLIDERSLAYLSDTRAFKLLIQNSREAVLRAGVSAGFYLLSDLAHRKHFPDSKVFIFLNAWDVRSEVRDAIKTRLQRDGKTLAWIYSGGLFEGGRPSLERVREVTGIAIRPQPFASRAGTTILNRKHPLTELLEERALSVVEQLEPSYFAIPEEGSIILGEYTQTGLPSFVVREIKGQTPEQSWRTVFLGEPHINEKIIRGLCALAGVQIWNYHGDVVHVRPPYLTIHHTGAGHRVAVLPDRWSAYDLVESELVSEDSIQLRSQATDGATQVLLVGEEASVQRIVSLDPVELCKVDELPEPEDDTVYREVAISDSPIIGSLQADEFLSLLAEASEDDGDEEELEPVRPKRTSGGRKTQSPRNQRKSPKKPKTDNKSGNIGVVFREKS